MEVIYTIWTWSKNTYKGDMWVEQKWRIEQAMKDVSFLGYDGIEHFAILAETYNDSPEEFDMLLKEYNLKFPAIYFHLTGDYAKDLTNAEFCCQFAKKFGATYMNIQAPWRCAALVNRPSYFGSDRVNVTEKHLTDMVYAVNEISKMAKKYGIIVCFHPHWNTFIESADEVEFMNKNMNNEVKFCLDTAHVALSGMDVVAAFNKYANRIGYVHLKDLDPEYLETELPIKGFTALGQGVLDIKGVVKTLQKHGYNGYLCVELDFPKVNNFESAMVSRKYLKEVAGV